MSVETLLKRVGSVENILHKYEDLLNDDEKFLHNEFGIETEDILASAFQNIENSERLLSVGIVGRVKSGKSSILNSLIFSGRQVLPEAATPMTAALSAIEHGNSINIKVDFYTEDDLRDMENTHNEYVQRLAILTEDHYEAKIRSVQMQNGEFDEEDIRRKAQAKAKRDLSKNMTLSAAYLQHEEIRKSRIDRSKLGDQASHKLKTLSDLSTKLSQYVAHDGEYNPFTKSVTITVPYEKLADIRVIDTPGVNDPIVSREERTRKLLKNCDVILLVSPSGQFITSQDEELMDRITEREGIRELYVISSMVDRQLFGSVKVEHDGKLHPIVKSINQKLSKQLHDTVLSIKENAPEVGKAYDQLIEESERRVFHTSSVCDSIAQNWEKEEAWSENDTHIWNRLINEYPDYFSNENELLSKQNLAVLGNTEKIDEILQSVRSRKSDLIKSRTHNLYQAKDRSFKQYLNELLETIRAHAMELENETLESLSAQKRKWKRVEEKSSLKLNETYQNEISSLIDSIKSAINRILRNKYRGGLDEIEGTGEVEKREKYWFSVFGFKIGRKVNEVYKFRTNAVRNSLENFAVEVGTEIDDKLTELIATWRSDVRNSLVGCLRAEVDDNELDVLKITKAIRRVVNSTEIPIYKYSEDIPAGLRRNGVLEGDDAHSFEREALQFLSRSRDKVKAEMQTYRDTMSSQLYKIKLAEMIFGNLRKKIEQLENQMESQGLTLERYAKLVNELKDIDTES